MNKDDDVEAAFERSEREWAEAVRKLNIADENHIEAWLDAHLEADADTGWLASCIADAHSTALSKTRVDALEEAAHGLDVALGGMLVFYGMDYDPTHDTQRVVHRSAEKAREQYQAALKGSDHV